jgi:thioredoxin-dependent peroxiredoxin
MIEVGKTAPAFKLRDQDGKEVALKDLRGGPVVLYFYPKADTPGCTTQACAIRDSSGDYEAAGARVLGVSRDEPEALKAFAEKYKLPFTLLSDPDHKVHEKYGAWGERSMYGNKFMGALRSTYVIDAKGKVTHVFPKVQPKKNDGLVLKALAELS